MSYRPCFVANVDCDAPANLEEAYTSATCFACGEPVCMDPGCSKRIRWCRFGRRRVCSICVEQHTRVSEQDRCHEETSRL